MEMTRIPMRAEDKNYAAKVIFKKESETKAYKDAACTTQLTTSELKNAFLKGAVILLDTGAYAIPQGYSETSSVGSVTYIVPNGTTATSADIASLAAVADPA